ncbi:MAG TPA: hypothetical protein VFU94_10660 [Conexibacter sp.]|nr:hypothetical protein [Conexibacter sp.]
MDAGPDPRVAVVMVVRDGRRRIGRALERLCALPEVLEALRGLPRVLRGRRPLPAAIEAEMARLDAARVRSAARSYGRAPRRSRVRADRRFAR